MDSSDAQQVDGEEMSGWEQYMNCCALVTNSNNFISVNL